MIISDISNTKKTQTACLWFSKHEFSQLTALYGQTVAANMFKDYSFELSPSGNWQKFHFKKHTHAESELWMQIEKQHNGNMYTVYDNKKAIKKRSSQFSRSLEYLQKCLYDRAPALHRHLFDPQSSTPQLSLHN